MELIQEWQGQTIIQNLMRYFQKQSAKERIHEKQTLVNLSSGCTNVRDGIGSVRNGLLCIQKASSTFFPVFMGINSLIHNSRNIRGMPF